MRILDNLCIATIEDKFNPGKPYCLWIEGNGRVGDKLNQGTGLNGKRFPVNCTDSFETRAEAVSAYYDFRDYVIDMVKKQGKSKATHKSSYHTWS